MVLRYWFCGRVFHFRSLLLRLLMQGSSEIDEINYYISQKYYVLRGPHS